MLSRLKGIETRTPPNRLMYRLAVFVYAFPFEGN